MFRVITAILIGAGLMYFFDPRQGAERRQKLSERANQGREQMDTAMKAGRESIGDARYKFRTRIHEAHDQAEDAMEDAQRNDFDYVDISQRHAHAVAGDENA